MTELLANATSYPEEIRSRVEKAVKIQNHRFQGTDIHSNSRMGQKEIQRFCQLKEAERRFARKVYEARGISARGYHRVLKTARTIADLAGEEWIQRKKPWRNSWRYGPKEQKPEWK